MTEKQTDQQPELDPIYTLPEEILKENARFKRTFGKSCTADQVMAVITGSVMPLIAQVASTVRVHDETIEEILANIDGEEGTQFTIEDAQRFELLVTYARESAKQSLESPNLDPNSEAAKKLVEIVAMAEGCLKTIEESTLTGDPEGEEDEESGAEGAGAN